MIYILNQNSSFIPPKDHAINVVLKHEVGYIKYISITNHCDNIMWMWNTTALTVDELDILKKHQTLSFESIPVPSKTRTCDSDDIIIIPLGLDLYNYITFKPINDNDPE